MPDSPRNKVQSRLFTLLVIATTAISSAAVTASAQSTQTETTETVAPATVTEQPIETQYNFREIETLGTDNNKPALDVDFGNDLYYGSKRSSLSYLISNLPESLEYPTLYKTTNLLLTTSADTNIVEDDMIVEAGNDLLTLRLEKMLERGLYKEIIQIYSQLEDPPYDDRLASAGALAMLMMGANTNACIEIKSAYSKSKDNSRLNELDVFCTYLLDKSKPPKELVKRIQTQSVLKKIIEEPDFAITYDPDIFASLSIQERAFLMSQNKLMFNEMIIDKKKQIPPSHVQPLLTIPNLSDKSKLYINAVAAKYGLINKQDMAELLLTIDQSDDPASPAYYFKRIKNEPDDLKRTELIKKMLDQIVPVYTAGIMISMGEELRRLDIKTLPPKQLYNTLKALSFANEEVPGNWLSEMKSMDYSKTPLEVQTETLYLLAHALSSESVKKSEQTTDKTDFSPEKENDILMTAKNIIENIDNKSTPLNNVAETYENGFDTGENKGYPISSSEWLKSLEIASTRIATGETVLLSSFVLDAAKSEKSKSQALRKVADSFEKIGLTNIAHKVAAEAVMNVTEK